MNPPESAAWQTADFEELEPERLDLGEHAVQRGAIRERSGQRGVRSARLSPEGGERRPHQLAEVAAYRDLVRPGLGRAACPRAILTGHETGQLATVVQRVWASC